MAPWKKEGLLPLLANPSTTSSLAAHLQSGVLANIKRCDGDWCRVFGDGYDGYIQQTSLWGVYPGERVE